MKNFAAKCLVFFILGWTGSFSNHEGCRRPTGYVGQLAEWTPNQRWTPIVGETVKEIVERNNALLKELTNRTAPNDCGDMVAWGTSWCDLAERGNPNCPFGWFGSNNVLTNENDYRTPTYTNYWVAGPGKVKEWARLFLYLGCDTLVHGIFLKNTHNAQHNNVGTNNFKIYAAGFQNGPWTTPIVEDSLDDANNEPQVRVAKFPLRRPITTKFLMFQIDSYYDKYAGGLQYFGIY